MHTEREARNHLVHSTHLSVNKCQNGSSFQLLVCPRPASTGDNLRPHLERCSRLQFVFLCILVRSARPANLPGLPFAQKGDEVLTSARQWHVEEAGNDL